MKNLTITLKDILRYKEKKNHLKKIKKRVYVKIQTVWDYIALVSNMVTVVLMNVNVRTV